MLIHYDIVCAKIDIFGFVNDINLCVVHALSKHNTQA